MKEPILNFSKSDKEARALWRGRKASLWSVLALREGSRCWTTDSRFVHDSLYQGMKYGMKE